MFQTSSGFTEKYRGDLRRIINPSGEFNVRRRGATWRDVHPYLFMINASWPVFAATIFGFRMAGAPTTGIALTAGYIAGNVVLYVLRGKRWILRTA